MGGDAGRGPAGSTAARSAPTPNWDLQAAFDHAPVGIAVLTTRGVIISGNRALGDLLGVDVAELVGPTFFDVTHSDDLPEARRNCELVQAGRTRIVRHECRFTRRDGSTVWVSVSTARAPAPAEGPGHLIMHVEDIDDRRALQDRLTHLALHDPLTGLANRALLDQRIRDALAGGSDGSPRWLPYLDLNGFKSVNDRHGHAVGDAVLQQLATRITALAAPGGTVARLGGDEFAVLGHGDAAHHGQLFPERLRDAAARPFSVDDRVIRLSAAMGLSTTSELDGLPLPPRPAALLLAADRRMYRAKAEGT